MNEITSIKLPIAIDWESKRREVEQHISLLDPMFEEHRDLRLFYTGALAEVYPERFIHAQREAAEYWTPYLTGDKPLTDFFKDWLTFTPYPENPGKYIVFWDILVNTRSGLVLANHAVFKSWFSAFLTYHGDWINSTESTHTLKEWFEDKGTEAHPFDIKNYKVPEGGFKSFNQFFLRNLRDHERPMRPEAEAEDVIIAPCDGGVFYLTRGNEGGVNGGVAGQSYDLPGKSDRFGLMDALPGFGKVFEGGPLLDILLWFTDYHHLHAPVSGEVIHQGFYHGSYNYDFNNYDPDHCHAPVLPSDSDRVGWYEKLGKHQRYVWIIRTKELGLVAMVAIGFWGVGSIINEVEPRAKIKKGEYMGRFGYGGSSIVLAFEPGLDLEFVVDNKGVDYPVQGPDEPTLMEVRQCLGKLRKPLSWNS